MTTVTGLDMVLLDGIERGGAKGPAPESWAGAHPGPEGRRL